VDALKKLNIEHCKVLFAFLNAISTMIEMTDLSVHHKVLKISIMFSEDFKINGLHRSTNPDKSTGWCDEFLSCVVDCLRP
jgi:hypothetical protein